MLRSSSYAARPAIRVIGGGGGRPLGRSRLFELLSLPPTTATATATRTAAAAAAAAASGGRRPPPPIPPALDRTAAAQADIDDPERGGGRGGGGGGGGSGEQHRQKRERARRSILAHALLRVHDMGWTDDAVASGTLDAGFPPSYVGLAASSSSSGNANLVDFFMCECNASLGEKLAAEDDRGRRRRRRGSAELDVDEMSHRINAALRARLSMVLPYVASRKWHEGMAIGALPQNALGTLGRLNDMAGIVLDHALGDRDSEEGAGDGGGRGVGVGGQARRAAIVAAYASAELHLLSDSWSGAGPGAAPSRSSLSGERHRATWTFLGARSAEAARLIVADVPSPPLSLRSPDPSVVAVASAAFSSLAGAALSLASPSAAASAATAVTALPRAVDSALGILRGVVGIGTRTGTGGGVVFEAGGRGWRGDGTRPGDYDPMGSAETLPPFDLSEEIFPKRRESVK